MIAVSDSDELFHGRTMCILRVRMVAMARVFRRKCYPAHISCVLKMTKMLLGWRTRNTICSDVNRRWIAMGVGERSEEVLSDGKMKMILGYSSVLAQ